jgi:hypothetical protein
MRLLQRRNSQSSTKRISLIEVHWSVLYLMKTCFVPSEMSANRSEEGKQAQERETLNVSKCFISMPLSSIMQTAVTHAQCLKFRPT